MSKAPAKAAKPSEEPDLARTVGGTLKKLGKYDITGELGRGAFGVVYKGHDSFVQRDVAIKVVGGQTGALPHEVQESFFSEARAAGKLHHPYVVLLYDAGLEGSLRYLVMEYIAGETLKRFTEHDGPRLSPHRVADIMQKCALALDYIHKTGVLHKDIKPGNIMVTANGTPKIMDFSIAAMAASVTEEENTVAGSPLYMPPEQLKGKALGPATDLYALGVVMYLLLSGGAAPYTATDPPSLFRQIRHLPPIPLKDARPDLPDAYCDLVMRLLSKDPKERHQNGRELAEDLARFTERTEGGKRRNLHLSHDSLKKLEFFKAFKSRELGELMDASETVTYKGGDFIIREGETDNSLYILGMGLAEVRKGTQLIALLEKGDCFGEIGFLYAVKRTASVVATTDVMVIKVNAALLEQMSSDVQLRYYQIFCENLILRLTLTTEKAAHLLPKSDLALDFILP